ncbi:Mpp10 protein-domain-containing protein [Chytriomyces sp. MP71]|nr:Mpp10 protein-domain-containing protein [Chytriomyces sp. MP71]
MYCCPCTPIGQAIYFFPLPFCFVLFCLFLFFLRNALQMAPTVVDKKRKRRPVPVLAASDTESDDHFDDDEEDAGNTVFVNPIDSLLTADDSVLAKPDRFLIKDPQISSKVLSATKWFFDLGKHAEPFEMSPLNELLIDGFDLDQVWEQMQLRNKAMLKYLNSTAADVIARGDLEDEGDFGEEEGDMDAFDDGDDEDEDFDKGMEDGEELMQEEEEEEEEDMEDDVEINGAFDTGDLEDGEAVRDEDVEDELLPSDDEVQDFDGEDEKWAPEDRRSFGSGRTTELDDEFFSLHEMEKFAERGEARDMRLGQGDDEEGDEWNLGTGLFSMDPDEMGGSEDEDEMNANDIKYDDYFAPPKQRAGISSKGRKTLSFSDTVDEREFSKDKPASAVSSFGPFQNGGEDDDEVTGQPRKSLNLFDLGNDDDAYIADTPLSKFEMEQRQLADQISSLENEAVAEKSWTLKGEVSGKARPANSLLEEDLEIEHASRPTPVVTEETTKTLEDLIKGRIAEELYDDVVRKAEPKEKKFDPNRRNLIDEEKSSKSLTDLYEADYRKKTGEKVKTEKDEAVEKSHREIDGLFKDLCMNLDALSNWHYTARAPVAELEVVAAPSVPALTIEEVIPSIVSDATLAAPKEVYAGKVGKSENEMEKEDKTKARKKQKRVFKKQKLEREREQKAAGSSSSGNVVESTKKGKERAMETLMKQKNVTIVADSKSGKGSAAEVSSLKGKGGKRGKAVKANVLERGGTIGKAANKAKPTVQSLML